MLNCPININGQLRKKPMCNISLLPNHKRKSTFADVLLGDTLSGPQ